ncbi:MAG: hypothetical protein WC593_07520 [Methanoregula sp.]
MIIEAIIENIREIRDNPKKNFIAPTLLKLVVTHTIAAKVKVVVHFKKSITVLKKNISCGVRLFY